VPAFFIFESVSFTSIPFVGRGWSKKASILDGHASSPG
jgi:hypothetical protein